MTDRYRLKKLAFDQVIRLANIGAGIVVGKVGTSVATKEEIIGYLEEGQFYSARKIRSDNVTASIALVSTESSCRITSRAS